MSVSVYGLSGITKMTVLRPCNQPGSPESIFLGLTMLLWGEKNTLTDVAEFCILKCVDFQLRQHQKQFARPTNKGLLSETCCFSGNTPYYFQFVSTAAVFTEVQSTAVTS